jgi:hypothetical protein
MLSAGDYTRDDLHSRYSAREIRAFLIKRQIVVDGCKEKSDLIELAMSISRAPDARRDDDLEHRRRVAQMKVRLVREEPAPRTLSSCFFLGVAASIGE